ncbi:glycoside hydrolase family 3 protein [Paenibacillus sp. VCA1]|uniref:glycoside hydrolase family 3 protein n=1 Tax=Paenibacillus sp. VCA1 TaxID=3039148 RepID=UPI0028715D60|nr:glycoside hydrolase family 3 protein [Paenibacillus sp. VCA1]MDR9853984.1 glycoside hydrolase family 3 protein [Paenibacillus sp. VCA1]
MRQLTLREKIGQLIVAGFPGLDVDEETQRLFADYKIGNVILFAHNVQNREQLKSLCAGLQRSIAAHTGHPALISIDQEGGRVTRLPQDAVNVPGAMAIASTGRPENAYAAGRITAREMRALGINFNLAPVLDINNNKRNPVINVRSYGDTAEVVTEYGLQMLRGLKDGGVLAAIKHFPGHGDTAVDSHLGLPSIDKPLEALEELELKPFRAAIDSGAECLTSAHILFPAIENHQVPATMSKAIITDLLKHKMGYEGLVISDCLEMDAIQKYYGTAEGAVGALKAGVHLLFISHSARLVKDAVHRIEQAVEAGELPIAVIDEAVEKVLFYKDKYGLVEEEDMTEAQHKANRRAAEAISLESICHVSGKLVPVQKDVSDTIVIGSLPYRPDQASSRTGAGLSFPAEAAAALGTAYLLTDINPDETEQRRIADEVQNVPNIIIGLYNGCDHQGQIELANRLARAGHQVTAVALGKPYDLELLEEGICGLAAFEYTRMSIRSVIRILAGETPPTGQLSLHS